MPAEFATRYQWASSPANLAHSSRAGLEEDGKPKLNQLFMRDFFALWTSHKKDPSVYPQLAKITDDNVDGMIEVKR